jgi:Putative peptidoglycan binding domain
VFFSDFGYPFGYPYWWDYYPYSYYDYDQSGYENAAPYDDSLVAQVQTRLARAGYYRGAIDGVMGPETRRAIRGYERSHGLRVDGMVSNELIGTMGLR